MNRRHVQFPLLALALIAVLLTACQPVLLDGTTLSIDPTAFSMTSTGSAATAEETAEAASEPTPEPLQLTLQPQSEEGNRPASEIFAEISPSVAFVETEVGTGSGVLIEHNYLLSNAHVVWPFNKVRVVFPDGSEHLDVPVHAWDLMADLALIGPIDTELPTVPLVDGVELDIGSDAYLIGYPAEVDEFPQPTITNGILSRLRSWDAIDYTFYQVDATITGGQSGGILVTHRGDVIGISTFYFSGFGMAGSVADALSRLNALLGNDTGVMLGNRPFGDGEEATTHTDTLDDSGMDTSEYILIQPADTEIELEAIGVGRPTISVQTASGRYIDSAGTDEDEQSVELSFTIEHEVPHIISISQPSSNENSFELISSHPLIPYSDDDDGKVIKMGETVMGTADRPSDSDYFEIDLQEGDIVEVVVDSLGMDPAVSVTYDSDTLVEVVSDDDSGGGIFGQNAQLIYEVKEDDTYRFIVRSYGYDGDVGSYLLTVKEAEEDAEITEPAVSHEYLRTRYGLMELFEIEEAGYSLLHPAVWSESAGSQCGAPGAVVCFVSEAAAVIVTREDLSELPKKDRNLEGYIDIVSDLLGDTPGIDILGFEESTTLQGLPAGLLRLEAQSGRTIAIRLAYINEEDDEAFNIIGLASAEDFASVEAQFEYLFNTFRHWTNDEDEREEDAVYQLDEAISLSTSEQITEAHALFDQSIELDPELVEAYSEKAALHFKEGEYDDAIETINEAVERLPEDEQLVYTRATYYWMNYDFENALAGFNTTLDINPDLREVHNFRALTNVYLEAYDEALADVDKYVEMNDDDLDPHVQDTRGYIYLKMGEFEKAKEDFDEIFDQDLRFAAALLGGGVAYAELGEFEMAQTLLEEGLEKIEETEIEFPGPQMTDLIEMAEKALVQIGE